MGTTHEGFSYAQKEVNPCHISLSVLVLTQAAVGLADSGEYCAEHKKVVTKRYNQYQRDPASNKRYGRS